MKNKNFGATRLITLPFYPLPTVWFFPYAAAVFGLCCYAIIRKNTPMGIAATFLIILPILSLIYAFICFCGISGEIGFDKQFLPKPVGWAWERCIIISPFPCRDLRQACISPKQKRTVTFTPVFP